MAITHNLGFPRIGAKRELKFALESYWKGESPQDDLLGVGEKLRLQNWKHQAQLDFIPVGDFSLYDHVLDMSFTLGNLPARLVSLKNAASAQSSVDTEEALDDYFRVARGRSAPKHHEGHCDGHDHASCSSIAAGEMTKWFDTNYHYIVPEFDKSTKFTLNPARLLSQLKEASFLGGKAKPVLLGPVSYLALGKAKDGSAKLDLLPALLEVYAQLLELLSDKGISWVQIDEPILVTDLDQDWQHAFNLAYFHLKSTPIRIMLGTYFGRLDGNRYLAANLPVAGLHVDATHGKDDIQALLNLMPEHKVLSLGVISGRNIWKSDLSAIIDWLEPIADKLGDRLWLAPSCSLLHVPVDLNLEQALDPEITSWLAFALQKLEELAVLARALNEGRASVQASLAANAAAIQSRRQSTRVHQPQVKNAIAQLASLPTQRVRSYEQRARKQAAVFGLPDFPTTTIGSFPQTAHIRQARSQFKSGAIDEANYQNILRNEIALCVKEQEALDLDVLVHGEAERNDMVEYFGEQLQGYAFTQFGWVQSYGSRCVKPPILYGDVSRPQPMTVAWAQYAQSLTSRPMKGMLTGPVTILNWSFVRDDQPRSESCFQLALAIRDEILDLEKSGIRMIQIDEAALREGLPLRRSEWKDYLDWAVRSFRIATAGVQDETQIHTHMCYSEFNDIIHAVAEMDADVITIETSRSDMELLDAFDDFNYPNEIGLGVYDIHSPNIPTEKSMVDLMQKAARKIPAQRLWVNPDCGLKTRQWNEVKPALAHMVAAAKYLRSQNSSTLP